jgi:hypothetical protein
LPPVPLLSIAADLDVFDQDTIGFALASLLRGRNAALAAITRPVRRSTGRWQADAPASPVQAPMRRMRRLFVLPD